MLVERIVKDLFGEKPIEHKEGPKKCASCITYFASNENDRVLAFDMGAYCYLLVESGDCPCYLKVIDGDDNSHDYDLKPRAHHNLKVRVGCSASQSSEYRDKIIMSISDATKKDTSIMFALDDNPGNHSIFCLLVNRLKNDIGDISDIYVNLRQ